jgi:CcmD family protein
MAGSDIYIVLIVTLIVWGGIFFYLMYLDSKLKSLKKKVDTFRQK